MALSRKENDAGRPLAESEAARMLVVEQCRSEAINCPNALIRTSAYARAIEEWAELNHMEERLKARLRGGPARFHQKLRIAIAGCPNSCSRPQIADLGVIGSVEPVFDPAGCAECGACREACPDGAISGESRLPLFDLSVCQGCKRCARACPAGCITLSLPRVRVLAGGKLGRRPRLADDIGEASGPEEFVSIAAPLIDDYLENAGPDERFADYWARARREGKE